MSASYKNGRSNS